MLNIVGQIHSWMSYGNEVVQQVQNNAPVKLLFGTDLQPHLGFALLLLNGPDHINLLPLQGLKETAALPASD